MVSLVTKQCMGFGVATTGLTSVRAADVVRWQSRRRN